MRHRAKVQHFSRAQGPRKALLRGLVRSLVLNGRIKTTLAKAKELRRHVERAVTMGKKGTVHSRRLLLSRYPNTEMVDTLLKDVVPRFQTRPGGYTRILKLGERPGDRAEMAFIEFVDYQVGASATEATETKSKGRKKAAKADAATDTKKATTVDVKARRSAQRAHAKKRRTLRKIQSVSRQESRA